MARTRTKRDRSLVALLLLASLLFHLPLAWLLWKSSRSSSDSESPPYLVMELSPPQEEPETPQPPEPPDDLQGQVVDIAPMKEPQVPEESNFLAEHNVTVPEETRSTLWEIAPEVLAPTWSKERRFERKDLFELNVERPSTGALAGATPLPEAVVGNHPDQFSAYRDTNKEGTADPTQSSHATDSLEGSPSNDYLDLPDADATLVNAREFLFASFLNRVKRLVSFYANQTLTNADAEIPLSKRQYELVLHAMLDPEGKLQAVRITKSSNVLAFDDAIVEAWDLAAPFANPPPGMVSDDGFVHIRDFGFVIQIGMARAEVGGYDLRSQERFPGLQTGNPAMQLR